DAVIEALADHDFVYCHVEATDEAGHSKDLELKIKTIEYLDQRLIARVLEKLERKKIDAVVAVLPDHPTPVEYGNHVKDAVPVAIRDPKKSADCVSTFDEESVKRGALGLMHGSEFMETVLGIR
ncbi:MAG: phosphoglycerate mutase, partial [candidate division WOR-3 bacterium]